MGEKAKADPVPTCPSCNRVARVFLPLYEWSGEGPMEWGREPGEEACRSSLNRPLSPSPGCEWC